MAAPLIPRGVGAALIRLISVVRRCRNFRDPFGNSSSLFAACAAKMHNALMYLFGELGIEDEKTCFRDFDGLREGY